MGNARLQQANELLNAPDPSTLKGKRDRAIPALLISCGLRRAGIALFQRVCELDLGGMVVKKKSGPYIADRENSTWFKIRNRKYSQMAGRQELFDRERNREPVPGWHSCVLACAELEETS